MKLNLYLVTTLITSSLALAAPNEKLEETKGKKPVLVAIIDTGLDFQNSYFTPYLWTNPGETGFDQYGKNKATNNRDDDGNGLIDDVHGWDFVNNTPVAKDNHGHGSHVAGLILGPTDFETKEVNSEIQILILKYYDDRFTKTDTIQNTVRAIQYALQAGADIINYSGGGRDPNFQELAAIEEAKEKGVLFVSAAGNEGENLNQKTFYPASYGLSNILAVTALNTKLELLTTSNYGAQHVTLSAPGKDLVSWLTQQKKGRMTGTSQATAVVAGIAAKLISSKPYLRKNPSEVKRLLEANADFKPELQSSVKNGAVLNETLSLISHDSLESAFGHVLENEELNSEYTIKNFSDLN